PLAPFSPASAWLPLGCGPATDPALGAARCPSGGASCPPAGATGTSGAGARLLGTPLPRARDPRLVLIRDLPGLEPPTSPRTRARWPARDAEAACCRAPLWAANQQPWVDSTVGRPASRRPA